jgi:hypothetical protein
VIFLNRRLFRPLHTRESAWSRGVVGEVLAEVKEQRDSSDDTRSATRSRLEGALRALERGFYLRNDYYNGINLAYMLNERAVEQTDLAEATADFILARRVRREVRDIADAWLKESSESGKQQPPDKIYWVHGTLAEACLGLGDEAASKRWLDKAIALGAALPVWARESTELQIKFLRGLLEAAAAKGIPLQAPSAGRGGS